MEDKIMDTMDLPNEIGSYKSNIQEPEQDAMEILEEIFESDEYQQEIIKKITIRSENDMDVTHRYDLRSVRSDWRTKYQDEYTAPVILSNLSTPKAIRLYDIAGVYWTLLRYATQ